MLTLTNSRLSFSDFCFKSHLKAKPPVLCGAFRVHSSVIAVADCSFIVPVVRSSSWQVSIVLSGQPSRSPQCTKSSCKQTQWSLVISAILWPICNIPQKPLMTKTWLNKLLCSQTSIIPLCTDQNAVLLLFLFPFLMNSLELGSYIQQAKSSFTSTLRSFYFIPLPSFHSQISRTRGPSLFESCF